MIKIPSAQQIRELDALTIAEEPVSSIDLMERAARAVAAEVMLRWDATVPVFVFAGPGNNGGDALAVARMLSEAQYQVTAFLFNTGGRLSQDCAINKERLLNGSAVHFTEVTSTFEPPAIPTDALILDGLFGTGLNKTLNGGFASLVKFINSCHVPVVSIDMPSGLMCEENTYNVRAHIVRATLTLTFQLPKLALLLVDNQVFVGELKVLDIGLLARGIEEMHTEMEMLEMQDVCAMLKPRPPFGHKGIFGHALLVAGKYGMAGAAILAAKACLRSGVGKVTVHTPFGNNDILQVAVPEAILSHDKDNRVFTEPVPTDMYAAVGVGPGIGVLPETSLAFIEQVRRTRVPLVIDADGLNILAEHKGWMQQVPKHSIMTPHPAEFRRLGNKSIDSYSTLAEARDMAERQQLYIVLKGHPTAICTPEGRVFFNPTGNSGMATAGSGDVLTGIIVALLAQKYSAEKACCLGVYLHGLAGDLAAGELGEYGMTASDLIAFLPAAFEHLRKNTHERKGK